MKKLIALFLAVTLTVSLVACSSSEPENPAPENSSEDAPATEEAKDDTDSNDTTEAEDTSKPAETASFEGFEGPTEPAKHPDNLKVAFVPDSAALSGCIVPVEAMQEICDRYGYEYQVFDGEGTSEGCNAAIMNAISWGPDVICCVSVLASGVQQALQAAKEAGIPVVSGSNGTDDPNPRIDVEYDFAYDIGPDYKGCGKAMAQWIYDNTEGSGKVVLYDCPGSYSVDYFYQGLVAGLDELNVPYEKDTDFSFDQLGDELNRIVAGYLTNNPDTEFIYMPFDPAAVSLISGLETAGFDDVKVLGVLGNTEMCTLIGQGGIAAGTCAYDNVYLGYAQFDQALRLLNGQELFVPHGENLPYAMIDATNLPAQGEAWTPDFEYKDAFYALWD
ncbi:MAG: sugar ABC transporter substrate-binding protein [Lachnospiraceae bacterium]|jgi:ribose transport system substrate-binding protein|nr:sugar ABC transporter substrate-binding protein [Lachnospiraceae bacterium]